MKKLYIFLAIATSMPFIVYGLMFYKPLKYEKAPGLSEEDFKCGRGFAHVVHDNPIERIPLYKVVVERKEETGLMATSYFFWGGVYREIYIEVDCSSTRAKPT
ncbi:hypothetical protein [Microbulbifer variabilis]|uniref:hypothetical protein n=1 Tax=Microbulbifer variabilis TaxID=266805 RepID=UPI00037FEF8E|nr:hypothetical protein [Microbulbifer variabilis]